MKNTLKKSLLATATMLACTSALAAPVMLRESGLGNGMATGGLILPISASSANYWAGLQTLVIDNSETLLAFCVDPWEWSSSSNQTYTANSLDSIFGTNRASFIRELYSESYSSTLQAGAAGNLSAAAFQLALWEIITDDNPRAAGLQTSFAHGLVQKVKNTDKDLLEAAQGMLNKVDGIYGSDTYRFDLYTSGKALGQGSVIGYQDFLIANKIPEPGAFSLMLGALGGMGLLTLRRRQKTVKA